MHFMKDKNLINNDSFEAIDLIKKHELSENVSILNTIESQYTSITNFISSLYLEKYDLPDDLKSFITQSYNYKIYLINNIEERMNDITSKSSVHIFKEIYILLNLLSNGKRYELLNEYNNFNTEALQKLLSDYENDVCGIFLKNDNSNFELSFKFYTILLELLNEVCLINAVDIQRRKNINNILELITNTISNVKSRITLDEKYISILNGILGKQLLHFTDLAYILIDKNNQNIVIQKYIFMLQKIYDGYNLLEQNDNDYDAFLNKANTLILTLIYKLKTKLRFDNINLEENKRVS